MCTDSRYSYNLSLHCGEGSLLAVALLQDMQCAIKWNEKLKFKEHFFTEICLTSYRLFLNLEVFCALRELSAWL